MAVLEHNPVTSHCATFDVLLGSVAHTLTEGKETELVHANANDIDEFLNI